MHQVQPSNRWKRRLLLCALVTFSLGVVLGLLFLINGTVLAARNEPVVGTTSHPPIVPNQVKEIRIVAHNVAKGFAHQGGLRFDEEEKVRQRMEKMGEVIRAEQPDLVFLSEVIHECTPCSVDQVRELAEKTGMHTWIFGENYNFGLPFYRVVGGNAILSKFPLEPVANHDLAGRKPFYKTHNNRRILWAAVRINGQRLLLGCLHTDSFSRKNNATQMRQILSFSRGQPTILAGDFNAEPDSETMDLVRDSNRFSGSLEGERTFPAGKPDRRIDYVFAPHSWELIDHRVLCSTVSDHRPVVSVYAVPRAP